MNKSAIRTYILKDYLPAWHSEPATNRQLKVLRFFGIPAVPAPSKGRASSIIGRLFSHPANKHLWTAYVYATGDEDDSTAELCPHDRAKLAQLVIPEDWRPRPRHAISNEKRRALEVLVADLLRDGSPFDDPLPEISIRGSCFALTGVFEFGSLNVCRQAVTSRGGTFTNGVTSKTDVLVVGSDASPAWAYGGYGYKIETAIVSRLEWGRPVIISEVFWKELLDSEKPLAARPSVTPRRRRR